MFVGENETLFISVNEVIVTQIGTSAFENEERVDV